MKILFYALTRYQGGIESFILNYLSHMDLTDIQVDFICMDETAAYEDQFAALGCQIFYMPAKRENRSLFYDSLQKVIDKGHYDIAWFNDNNLCDIHFLQMAKKSEIPVRICHSHNSSMEGDLAHQLVHRMNGLRIKQYATDLFACSKTAAKWAFRDAKQVKVIPNAIEVRGFLYDDKTRSEMRKSLGLENKYVIGHVGRLSKQKNHMFLLDVFCKVKKLCPDAVLLLCGDGEERNAIEQKVTELQLQDAVQLLGHRKDVPQLLQAFDLLLFPSFYEGLSVTVLEAQAAGLPCLVSEHITEEGIITSVVKMMKLQEGADAWAQEAVSLGSAEDPLYLETSLCTQRVQAGKQVQNSAYNIDVAAVTMQNWLMEQIQK